MSEDNHLSALFHLLTETEALLSRTGERAGRDSWTTRVGAVIDRGWDRQTPHEDDVEAPPSDDDTRREEEPPERVVEAAEDHDDSAPAETGLLDRYKDLSAAERRERLTALEAQVRSCTACPLSTGRTNAVPGEGSLDPMVMIIGEGPGYNEDQQGRPFVGRAGQYLDKWLESIGLSRETDVFIANIVKCRPPDNRDPKPDESDACAPYLREQIALVRPKVIVTVGRISMRVLTGSTQGISRIHGTFFRYGGIPLVPTFHPSGVLRNPAYRRPVWEDLKKIRNWLIDNAGHHVDGVASTDG